MRIRPYIESKDYEYLETWIDSERTHAFWCANRLPYPITRNQFREFLEKNEKDWTDSAFVATENDGRVMGFFSYSINLDNNEGFLKFVILDPQKRGTGCGKEMLRLALRYAFFLTGADTVRLNVFEENTAAKRCYERVGFCEKEIAKDVFSYKGKTDKLCELWNRCSMVISKQLTWTDEMCQ